MQKTDIEAWLTINTETGKSEFFVEKVKGKRKYLDSIVIEKTALQIMAQNILCVFPVTKSP